MLPPDDPIRNPQPRADLPPVPGNQTPVGYSPGLQIGERLKGLGLIIVGLLGLAFVWLINQSGGLPGAPPPPAAPPGLSGITVQPIISVTSCMVPMIAIGSIGLILVGMRQIVDP